MAGTRHWATAGRWFTLIGTWWRNPDVRQAGLDPLTHYLRRRGRGPLSLPLVQPVLVSTGVRHPAEQSPLEHFLLRRTVSSAVRGLYLCACRTVA